MNNFYKAFLTALGAGELERRTVFETGEQALYQNGIFIAGSQGKTVETADLVEHIKPEPHLFIFGAGHVSKALYDLAVLQGMKVTVADERLEVCNELRFPKANRILMPYPEILSSEFDVVSPYYIIVTHGHSYDSQCLEYALKHKSSYIGMIGSKGKVAATMQEMLNKGFTQEQLDKVCSPIGLKIGAVTPEEIAISIMAEIISYFRSDKNLVTVDPNLIKILTKESGIDVRIVEKHGSAPRSVGSQMFVTSTGQLYGTIGGGAIENRSIEIAKQMLKDHQNYHLEQFTLDASSDLGMICGGNAKVLFSLI